MRKTFFLGVLGLVVMLIIATTTSANAWYRGYVAPFWIPDPAYSFVAPPVIIPPVLAPLPPVIFFDTPVWGRRYYYTAPPVRIYPSPRGYYWPSRGGGGHGGNWRYR